MCSQIYPLLDNALYIHTQKNGCLQLLHFGMVRATLSLYSPFFCDSDIDLNLFLKAALHLWDVWQTMYFFKDNFCLVALILNVWNS